MSGIITLLFERGPMPIVSLFFAIIGLITILAVRPRRMNQFMVVLALCALPLIAGIVGYRMGMQAVHTGWEEFLAADPGPEMIALAKQDKAAGKVISRDPLYFGLALSFVLMLLNTVIFVNRRSP